MAADEAPPGFKTTPLSGQSGRCRDCHSPVVWCRTRAGKNIPLERFSRPWGDYIVISSTPTLTLVAKIPFGADESRIANTPRYACHLDKCRAKKMRSSAASARRRVPLAS